MDQPTLFKPPKPVANLRPLTDRQARIYALICSVPGGVHAEELGAMMHANRRRHPVEEPCQYCGRDGMRAINERAVRQRVVRRPGGVYEAINERDRAADPRDAASSQMSELPGETWEDVFGVDAA
jgi:hypothetical protein